MIQNVIKTKQIDIHIPVNKNVLVKLSKTNIFNSTPNGNENGIN